jgi:hypothetical protein
MNIADLKVPGKDWMGDDIRVIYGFKPPEYAVYGTEKRLLVQFADEHDLASDQRKGLAPLNPIRGEINGLIDGWRSGSELRGLPQKASRYDRRVGDALVVALEHDVDSAKILLEAIKQDILDERTSSARLQYLLVALGISVGIIVLGWLVLLTNIAGDDVASLWRAAAAGALGAFFSIAINIRARTVLPDLRWTSNMTDASLRIVIGFIGASVLMALVQAKAVTVGLGEATFASAPHWLFALIVGFLAGFSERLVPDLLAKANTSPQPQPPVQPLPAAAAGKAAAGGAAAASGGDAPDHTDSAQPTEDPAPHEAGIDHCLCDVELLAPEVTHDAELPAASGGVTPAEGGQGK